MLSVFDKGGKLKKVVSLAGITTRILYFVYNNNNLD